MAESQVPFTYTAQVHADLEAAISSPRIAPYLYAVDGADQTMAIKLYLWNARIAKSFLYPLHIAEVTLRNAMHETFSVVFGGDDWMMPGRGQLYSRLTSQSQTAINKALDRLAAKGVSSPTPNDVVATITFDFWSNLFRKGYSWLWKMQHPVSHASILHVVFPLLPSDRNRGYIKEFVLNINSFRNRVAHHEPVYCKKINHRQIYEDILTFIGFRCLSTSEWVRRHSTVMSIIRSVPTPSSYLPGRSLKTVNLRPPLHLAATDKLSKALDVISKARPALALVPDASETPPYRLVTASMLMEFINAQTIKDDGLLDVVTYTVQDVIDATLPLKIEAIDDQITTGDVTGIFFSQKSNPATRIHALVVMNSAGVLLGCIVRPDFRY